MHNARTHAHHTVRRCSLQHCSLRAVAQKRTARSDDDDDGKCRIKNDEEKYNIIVIRYGEKKPRRARGNGSRRLWQHCGSRRTTHCTPRHRPPVIKHFAAERAGTQIHTSRRSPCAITRRRRRRRNSPPPLTATAVGALCRRRTTGVSLLPPPLPPPPPLPLPLPLHRHTLKMASAAV